MLLNIALLKTLYIRGYTLECMQAADHANILKSDKTNLDKYCIRLWPPN